MPDASTDHRRATAERNVEAILDAAEGLLARGAAASTTAVAAAAGVSRVTVYAHFPTREALLEAVAERMVRRAGIVLGEAGIDEGPPADALARLVRVAWAEIERHGAIGHAAREQLSAAALLRAHDVLRAPLARLVARGRAEGAFREDLPTDWLVSSWFALMHACADDVRAGTVAADGAVELLQTTLGDLFAGPAATRRGRSRRR